MVNFLSLLLPAMTVALNIGLFALALFIISGKKGITISESLFFWAMIILSLAGIIGSLFYSEVMSFAPCVLCNLERWLLYPIFPLSIVALLSPRSRKEIWPPIFALGIGGSMISFYHSLLQTDLFLLKDLITICNPKSGVACTERYFVEWGYVTIPVMSLTMFLGVVLLAVTVRR
ncbi:MAG: disulfide bond formation protein B [Candidatus Harrisonbacteria bacterium]|nr:disulfide bond formation protein B [Candidatus Harrisonbacteria bacterium]